MYSLFPFPLAPGPGTVYTGDNLAFFGGRREPMSPVDICYSYNGGRCDRAVRCRPAAPAFSQGRRMWLLFRLQPVGQLPPGAGEQERSGSRRRKFLSQKEALPCLPRYIAWDCWEWTASSFRWRRFVPGASRLRRGGPARRGGAGIPGPGARLVEKLRLQITRSAGSRSI